jgi:hypothetical protein
MQGRDLAERQVELQLAARVLKRELLRASGSVTLNESPLSFSSRLFQLRRNGSQRASFLRFANSGWIATSDSPDPERTALSP